MSIPFNKVCELEDFSAPELKAVIREIFGPSDAADGLGDSKQWEIAMSCRALREFGALTPESIVLGVGAGTEVTPFYLTRHIKQVVATDLYLAPGRWSDVAPPLMLVEPERFAPYPFQRERLSVQHMDGRLLRFPDDTFDGVFSSGSIEHFGSLDYVANAAFEMGRVVKPGGVVTLSTELKLNGPPEGDGWEEATLILAPDRIQRYIVEASGLELVDELRVVPSEATLRTERDLATFLAGIGAAQTPAARAAYFPNLVLVHEGYVFASVHLTLRKPAAYPVVDNQWARPSVGTERAVGVATRELERVFLSRRAAGAAAPEIALPATANAEVESLLGEFDMYFSGVIGSRIARRLPGPLASLYRAYLRVRYLGPVWRTESALFHALARSSGSATLVASDDAADPIDRLDEELWHLKRDVESERVSNERDRDQLSAIAQRLESTEEHLKVLARELRLSDYLNSAGSIGSFAPDGAELIKMIRSLEGEIPRLAAASSVDVTIAGDDAEAALLEVCDYFGERLSARPDDYRMPNDAWYEIDLTGGSIADNVLANASAKLAPGGVLVLVAARSATVPDAAESDALQMLHRSEREFRGGPVQVHAIQVSTGERRPS